MKKIMKQKYFVPRELRISIALIILWSLLVTAFFTYFAKELGEKVGSSNVMFVLVMLGYILIVVALTMFFSHRLLGPFQRLMTEMRLIRSGEYSRRLNVRTSDDIYIRSFISEVNKFLEDYEKLQFQNRGIMINIDSEMMNIVSLIEEGEPVKEELRESVLACHKKLRTIAGA